MNSSQLRLPKIEASDPTILLHLLARAALAAGPTKNELGKMLTGLMSDYPFSIASILVDAKNVENFLALKHDKKVAHQAKDEEGFLHLFICPVP